MGFGQSDAATAGTRHTTDLWHFSVTSRHRRGLCTMGAHRFSWRTGNVAGSDGLGFDAEQSAVGDFSRRAAANGGRTGFLLPDSAENCTAFYGSSEQTGGIAYDRDGQSTLHGGVGRARCKALRSTPTVNRDWKARSAAVFTQGNRRRKKNSGAWLTADAVKLRPQRGEITLIGRRGQTVKIAGRRVNLAEVTARLRRIDGVSDAWVGIRGGDDPILAAVVTTKLPLTALRVALHAHRHSAVENSQKNGSCFPSLPLTERGKTDTRALQALDRVGPYR